MPPLDKEDLFDAASREGLLDALIVGAGITGLFSLAESRGRRGLHTLVIDQGDR